MLCTSCILLNWIPATVVACFENGSFWNGSPTTNKKREGDPFNRLRKGYKSLVPQMCHTTGI